MIFNMKIIVLVFFEIVVCTLNYAECYWQQSSPKSFWNAREHKPLYSRNSYLWNEYRLLSRPQHKPVVWAQRHPFWKPQHHEGHRYPIYQKPHYHYQGANPYNIYKNPNIHQHEGVNWEAIENSKLSNAWECARSCEVNGPPKNCYYKFVIELYYSNGDACKLCSPNAGTTLTNNCQCVLGDGYERAVKTVNRQVPGPSIRVCQGDNVIIDVMNRMEGEETSIHWHGVLQEHTQYYDGVPFVTQCPIPQGTNFRYHWHAKNIGTHFWHSHSGLQEMDGIYGSIIIRMPKSKEITHNIGHLYDYDDYAHVIIISGWMHEQATEHFPGRLINMTGQIPRTFLINGKGRFNKNNFSEPLEIFYVQPTYRYRFRLINAFGSVCPSRFTIQDHKLTVFAADGDPVEPVVVDSITSFTGERYDFIIHANKQPRTYWIQLRGLGECGRNGIYQLAQLRYKGSNSQSMSQAPTFNNSLPKGVILNPFDLPCKNPHTGVICINKLRNALPIDKDILKEKPDYKIFLPFQFQIFQREQLFRPNTYKTFLVAPNGNLVRSLINNISSVFPPSPLLSQYNNIPQEQLCNFMNVCENCNETRTCTHVVKIPRNSVVEIIVVDEVQVPNLSHPFHLHGHSFHVMNMDIPTITSASTNHKLNCNDVIKLDRKGLLVRNFDRPPLKDTLAVPRSGHIIIRFKANNPGFWLLHCHFQFHIVIGMNLIFHIGELNELPPVPPDFPRCGNFPLSNYNIERDNS